jgi:hypothetical protein
MNFAELTQVAMLGTERQSVSLSPPTSPLAQLQSLVDINQRERALLSLAALNSLHEQIGSLPARDAGALPPASAAESQPRAGDGAGSLLTRLLGGDFADLLPEWLALATQAGVVAPPEFLPALLQTGASKPELRDPILPVLGQRGRWLAMQNPDWSWVNGAASEDENLWHTGERAARLVFLRRLRTTNAARARELLAATWKAETPEDRATFLAAFDAGLSLEDEPFLEAALDDKRKEVRRTAATLLAQLPGSALVQRLTQRVRPLLTFLPGSPGNVLKFKKAKPAQLQVTLPAECDKAMQRDGVEPRAPQGFGEKAWWLIQLLEAVPLDLWTSEWNSTPAEIIAASQAEEWKKEFLEAWIRAAIRQRNAPWAEWLFTAAVEARRFDKFEGLLAVISPWQRETRVAVLLAKKDTETSALRGTLLLQCRHPWSLDFSRSVLAFMRKETAQNAGDWSLRNQFKDFATHLAPEALAEAPNAWPTVTMHWEFWSPGVDAFLAATQFRAELRAAFPPAP